MKSVISLLLLLRLAATAAAQDAAPAPRPPWLDQKIAGYQKLPPFSPPRSILRAKYAGKPAYYVSPACCDIPSELYDEGGSLLCYPDGGFAGGDGRCPSFSFVDNPPSVVWRDDRGLGPKTGKQPSSKQ